MSHTQRKLSNFVAQLFRATKLTRKLLFRRQTIAKQTWLLVTQTTT